MYMNVSTFLALKNPVLNFFDVLSSRSLLSYKPLSYTRMRKITGFIQSRGKTRKITFLVHICKLTSKLDFLH